MCLHPKVVSAVKSLLGPNIVLLSSTVFTKYPPETKNENYNGDFVGWHQDMKYWGLVNLRKGDERIKLASMWLAIDEVHYFHEIFQNRDFHDFSRPMKKTEQCNLLMVLTKKAFLIMCNLLKKETS